VRSKETVGTQEEDCSNRLQDKSEVRFQRFFLTLTCLTCNPIQLLSNMAPKRKGSSKSASMDQDPPSDAESDASSSGSSAPSLIDVDFDFFAPNADVDLIALKRLLRQLLHTDSDLFDLHTVGETVLAACERDGVGSCIKVDGEESDPFSFLSVLNLNVLKVSASYSVPQTMHELTLGS
jgi:hypothetical protein